MTQRRILWVTPKWPLPASDGARQATSSALRAVSELGEKIDLLSFVDRTPAQSEIRQLEKELGIKQVYTILKVRRFGKLSRLFNLFCSTFHFSDLPFTIIPFQAANLLQLLNPVRNETSDKWSYIVFDGLHTGASFIRNKKRTKFEQSKFIYRAHNLEANLWQQAAKNAGFVTRLLMLNQKKKIARFEADLVATCDAVAPVSSADLEQFKSVYKTSLIKLIPIGFDFSSAPQKQNNSTVKLLYVGSTSWQPNKEGLLWFLREVWPELSIKRQDISLTVVGRGTEKLIDTFNNLSRIRLLGEVKNLDSLYLESSASLVPIFSGSGTRVKAIEASRFGRVCISTALGVEGLPLEQEDSYLRAETKEEWISILSTIKSEKLQEMGLRAYHALRKDFDTMSVGKAFIDLLNEA